MSNIYTDIKLDKLENLLVWLNGQPPTEEMTRVIKRVEQQIVFLSLPDEEAARYFDSVKDG